MSTFSITAATAEQGSITVNPDGTLSYRIPAGFEGDTITCSLQGQIVINTLPADRSPMAEPDSAIVVSGGTVEIDALVNDVDPEGGTLTLVGATTDIGSVTLTPEGRLFYVAPEGGTNIATVTYTVIDGGGNESTGIVSVQIVELSIVEGGSAGEFVVSSAPGTLTVTVVEPAEDAGDYPIDAIALSTGPVNLVPPRISGLAEVGSALAVQPGLWAFDEAGGPLEVTRQWLRGAVPIEGCTSRNYTTGPDDAAKTLTVIETASTGFGSLSVESTAFEIRPAPVEKPVWTPSKLPGLAFWFDASDASAMTLSGNEVIELLDKSGAGRHARRVGAIPGPSLDADLNGKPVLRFSQGSILRTGPANVPDLSGVPGITIIAVTKAHLPSGFSRCLGLHNDSRTSGSYMSVQTGYSVMWFGNGNRLWAYPPSGPVIDVGQYIQGGTHAGARWWRNGTELNPTSTVKPGNSVTLPSDAYLQLGNDNGLTSQQGEIVVLTGSVADEDRLKAEGYLAHKWGLAETLPEAHPYRMAPPA